MRPLLFIFVPLFLVQLQEISGKELRKPRRKKYVVTGVKKEMGRVSKNG